MRETSELIVRLDYLQANIQQLRKIAPQNRIIFMVKGNAYGHGLVEITKFAYEECGVQSFGVACLGEAIHLREELGERSPEIIVFSDTEIYQPKNLEKYRDYKIIPVIHTLRDLKFVLENADDLPFPLWVKFNTGMNRLGISKEQLPELLTLLKNHKITTLDHVMTHFSVSTQKITGGDFTTFQYQNFKEIKKNLDDGGITLKGSSCANSGAIIQEIGLEETHIRPGLMLYGPSEVEDEVFQEKWINQKIISSLQTKIIREQKVEKGMTIGYGNAPVIKNGIVVYLSVGYADGLLTYYTPFEIEYNGIHGHVIGRINMDMVAFFFETEDIDLFELEDSVTLWGHDQQKLLDLSNQLKTISYQLFTGITPRVSRRYLFSH